MCLCDDEMFILAERYRYSSDACANVIAWSLLKSCAESVIAFFTLSVLCTELTESA